MRIIKVIIFTFLLSVLSCKSNEKPNDNDVVVTINDTIEVNEDRQLQFLFYANGGLIGYFDDGTIVGCPRCDLMDENIKAIKSLEPHSKFKIVNNVLISEQGDTIPIHSMTKDEWAIVDYKNTSEIKIDENSVNGNAEVVEKLKNEIGIGIIIPETDSLKYSEKFCCILSPKQGFTAYNEPNGKVIGKIKRIGSFEKNDQFAYEIYFVSETKKIKLNDYSEIGYEIFALNFTDSIDGFVKLKNQSANIWFSVKEIERQGFKTINWLDYMVLNSENVLGYYAKEPGLRIRKEPNTTSEIIGSARGDLYEIKLTKNISGQWVKVNVTKFQEHPCSTDLDEKTNIEYKTEGWMKIIDDNGEPNLYNYVRGC